MYKVLISDNVAKECVDILHFWLLLCLKIGASPNEIFNAYYDKMQTNIRRQEEGY